MGNNLIVMNRKYPRADGDDPKLLSRFLTCYRCFGHGIKGIIACTE